MTVAKHESPSLPARITHARWASSEARWIYPYGAVHRVLAGVPRMVCASVSLREWVSCMRSGGITGKRSFLFDAERNTMGTFAESAVKLDANTPRIEVMTECIDELVAARLQAPGCIKINAEGASGEVLRGTEQILQKHRPSLFVELHLSGRPDEERQSQVDVTQGLGYRVSMLDGMPVEPTRLAGEYHAWCALRESAESHLPAKNNLQTSPS